MLLHAGWQKKDWQVIMDSMATPPQATPTSHSDAIPTSSANIAESSSLVDSEGQAEGHTPQVDTVDPQAGLVTNLASQAKSVPGHAPPAERQGAVLEVVLTRLSAESVKTLLTGDLGQHLHTHTHSLLLANTAIHTQQRYL